jgi:hypothetical protein
MEAFTSVIDSKSDGRPDEVIHLTLASSATLASEMSAAGVD